jgi:hypothetical protein
MISNYNYKNNPKRATTCTSENIPTDSSQNIPIELLGQYGSGRGGKWRRRRRYNKVQEIEALAASRYKENGKGITFHDLLSNGYALHKKQAQITLKHCLRMGLLFSLGSYKPQQYYPTCLKSEISKAKMSKNIPIEVTEVGFSDVPHFSINSNNNNDSNHYTEPLIVESLEGYVLPLLPSAPLHIHKLNFKLKIRPECYNEIALPAGAWNKGKEHEEIIGSAHVRYHFYANGTVMVFTESSNNPFKVVLDNSSNFLRTL